MVRRGAGFVYFVRAGHYVKIGFASNVGARVRNLQSANPLPLELVKVLEGDESTEKALHRRFHAQRVRGEWFHLDDVLRDYLGLNEAVYHPTDYRAAVARHCPAGAAIVDNCEGAVSGCECVGALIFLAMGYESVPAEDRERVNPCLDRATPEYAAWFRDTVRFYYVPGCWNYLDPDVEQEEDLPPCDHDLLRALYWLLDEEGVKLEVFMLWSVSDIIPVPYSHLSTRRVEGVRVPTDPSQPCVPA